MGIIHKSKWTISRLIFTFHLCFTLDGKSARQEAVLRQTPGFVQVWWSQTGLFWGGVGVFPLSMWSPQVSSSLILLHVSPISTNGAAIVPWLGAALPSAQSPWVSKLNPVMFGLLPTHTGIHGYSRTPTHSHTYTATPIHLDGQWWNLKFYTTV